MFNGYIHYKWSFSIAMLNYQRVVRYQECKYDVTNISHTGGCPKLWFPKTALAPPFRDPFAIFRAPAQSGSRNYDHAFGCTFLLFIVVFRPFAKLKLPFRGLSSMQQNTHTRTHIHIHIHIHICECHLDTTSTT